MTSSRPPLHGLVLAGGRSRRMGRDKGALSYAGEALVVRAWRLLDARCASTRVSVRAEQAGTGPYADLPVLTDEGRLEGPAAGLLAAWDAEPGVALCVLAVDLPLVDEAMLAQLIAARDPDVVATAYVHVDGTPEPLCAIWEPTARGELAEREPGSGISLRRVLEDRRVRLIQAQEPERLASINTSEDLARAERWRPGRREPQSRDGVS